MTDQPHGSSSLEARVERLERQLVALSARLDALPDTPEPSTPAAATPAAVRERGLRWALRGEQWTGRVGLALLFLGLVFLFQYSIEQGWITPLVRVLFGVALGGAFLALGLRLQRTRPSYGALLLAGSVATLYATGWAAFELYSLVSRPPALGWMAGVTLLALSLAWRQQQPALASLGAAGGFATPFLLGAGSDSVLELTVYATLVVLWTAALYFARGWRTVLWTYAVGGLGVLAVAGSLAGGGERWAVQAGVLLAWALGVALPFAREAREAGDDDPHPGAPIPFALELRALGVGGSAAMLAISARLWALGDAQVGGLSVVVAALYGAFAWNGTRRPNFVARSAAPVAAALLASGTLLLLGGAPLWWALGLQALALVRAGSQPRWRGVEWVGHGLFGLVALALAARAVAQPTAAFDPVAWSLLGAVLLGVAASAWVIPSRGRWAYRLAAHALVLLWLAAEFGALAAGTEWVTLAWGTYGAGLLLGALEWGRRRRAPLLALQAVAGSALALTVLKLLVVDLAEVSALIRVGLFLGTGSALLALSSLFQRPGRSDAPVPDLGPGRGARR